MKEDNNLIQPVVLRPSLVMLDFASMMLKTDDTFTFETWFSYGLAVLNWAVMYKSL